MTQKFFSSVISMSTQDGDLFYKLSAFIAYHEPANKKMMINTKSEWRSCRVFFSLFS